MEVEVKIRLSKQEYERAMLLFHEKAVFLSTKSQTNYFFDSPSKILKETRTVFRIRKSETNDITLFTSTVKGKALLMDGISRVEEQEDKIPNEIATEIIENKVIMPQCTQFPTMKYILNRFENNPQLIATGEFKNIRNVFKLNQWTLEVDETIYDFGTAYEIEIETDKPEQAKLNMYAYHITKLTDSQHVPFE